MSKMNGVLVTFEADLSEEACARLADAIRSLRHVIDVAPVPANLNDYQARQQVRYEIADGIRDLWTRVLDGKR